MKNKSVSTRRILFAALACFFSGTPVIAQVWNLPGSGTWADADTDFTPTYNNGGPATFSDIAGGTITLTNPLTPTVTTVDATSGTYIFQTGIISGTGSLVKSNGGTLTLTSGNTFTGGVTVNGGLLIFSGSGSVANNAANTLTINNGGTVRMSRNDTWGNHAANVVIPIVVNAGGLLTNASLYTTLGPVTLNGGSITSNGGVNSSFQAFTFKSTVTVNGATTSTISGSGTNSAFHLGAAAVTGTTFNVADGAAATDLLVSGVLTNGRNTANNAFNASSLTKNGAGLMALTGANTYTGTTNISAGTLALTGSGTLGTGNVIVNGILDIAGITPTSYTLGTAQVLSGDGTINATLKTLNVNGTLAPGNSAGSLDVTGNVVLAGTTTANFEIDGPSSNDLLAVTGSLTYAGALNINTTQTAGSFDLFNFGSLGVGDFSSITLSNALSFPLASDGLGNWTGNNGSVSASFTGSTGVLEFAVIPEPSTLVLGGLALLGFAGVGLRWRRMTHAK